MSSLSDAIASLTEEDGAFRGQAPEKWTQGRTLYGGMTAALATACAQRAYADLPPLRTAQFAFVGPASGLLTFRPTLLRQGRSATIIGVECEGEAGLAARSTLFFGGDRDSRIVHDRAPAPAAPPPDACEPFFDPASPRRGFSQNFEYRLASGYRLLSQGPAPEFLVWIRHLDEEGVDPTIALLALADGLPPSAIVQFPSSGPISTMTWGVDLNQPVSAPGWRLFRSSSEQAAAGYSLQDMEVWNAAGAWSPPARPSPCSSKRGPRARG